MRCQKRQDIRLGYGVMVTLQILVLSFQVRILVAQQEKNKARRCRFIDIFLFYMPCDKFIYQHRRIKQNCCEQHHLAVFSQRHNGSQERACGAKRLASIARPILSPILIFPPLCPLPLENRKGFPCLLLLGIVCKHPSALAYSQP